MDEPPFPHDEADLDAWSVYADWLLTRGDPRGEQLASSSRCRPASITMPCSRTRSERRSVLSAVP